MFKGILNTWLWLILKSLKQTDDTHHDWCYTVNNLTVTLWPVTQRAYSFDTTAEIIGPPTLSDSCVKYRS